MKKRILCLVVLLSVILSVAVPAWADSYDDLRRQMLDSFQAGEMLDIGEYKLSVQEVQDIYNKLYHSGQMPWYADEDCDFVYAEDGTVKRFRPKTLNPRIYDWDLYEQKLAELIAATCLPEMSDWQKALSVHEYIVLHTIYDEQLLKNTGYDSLINGTTVCYGYSMLYMDVMNRLGIPCQIVIAEDTGDGYGHAWNVVQLDDRWYHVDATWADPVPDIYGYSNHRYFLKTDEEFRQGEEPHDFAWEALVEIAEESYTQDDFMEEVNSPVCFLDANHVVFRREKGTYNTVVSRNLATGEETVLQDFYRKEMNLGYGWYLYPTYGLNMWNGRFYFNRENKVLSMLPDGSDLQEIYTYEIKDRYIIGAMVDAGILYLTLVNHEGQMERTEVTLETAEFHTHSYEKQIVFATCREDGYHHMVCDCGVSYNRTVIPKIDHLMKTTVEKAPTQLEAGVTCHSCITCDYKEYEYPPALPAPPVVEEEAPEQIPLWMPAAGAGALLCVIILIIVPGLRKKRRSRA